MSDRVKVAVIGVGYFGNLHAQKFAACEGADLVAVCDTDPDRAATAAQSHNSRPVVDFREILHEVDAVSIVVPTTVHFEVARTALEAGKDVLIEKPICETLEQCDALIEIAKANDRILQVGHLERFSPAIKAIKEEVGEPGYIESARISPFRGRGTDTTVILDMMIHDLDHVVAIAGAPLESVDAVGVPVATPEEDIANARLRFANGCVATVTASRISWGIKRNLRVFQRDAYIVADFAENKMVVMRKEGTGDGPMKFSAEEKRFDQVDLLQLQADAFVRSVRDRTAPIVSGEDVRPVLEAALLITSQLRDWRSNVFDVDSTATLPSRW